MAEDGVSAGDEPAATAVVAGNKAPSPGGGVTAGSPAPAPASAPASLPSTPSSTGGGAGGGEAAAAARPATPQTTATDSSPRPVAAASPPSLAVQPMSTAATAAAATAAAAAGPRPVPPPPAPPTPEQHADEEAQAVKFVRELRLHPELDVQRMIVDLFTSIRIMRAAGREHTPQYRISQRALMHLLAAPQAAVAAPPANNNNNNNNHSNAHAIHVPAPQQAAPASNNAIGVPLAQANNNTTSNHTNSYGAQVPNLNLSLNLNQPPSSGQTASPRAQEVATSSGRASSQQGHPAASPTAPTKSRTNTNTNTNNAHASSRPRRRAPANSERKRVKMEHTSAPSTAPAVSHVIVEMFGWKHLVAVPSNWPLRLLLSKVDRQAMRAGMRVASLGLRLPGDRIVELDEDEQIENFGVSQDQPLVAILKPNQHVDIKREHKGRP